METSDCKLSIQFLVFNDVIQFLFRLLDDF